MIPKRSPFSLIQEDLWPDEWKILVSCLMLNCTSRKQVEKVIPGFFLKWPDADCFLMASDEDVKSLIAPLGFKNRRTKRLFEMTSKYVKKDWSHAKELPGVGVYASRAWEIFVKNIMGFEAPQDGALVVYWKWREKHGD